MTKAVTTTERLLNSLTADRAGKEHNAYKFEEQDHIKIESALMVCGPPL